MATLFTKIIRGEIKGTIVYQDELCAALLDIDPKAPKHILIVPKKEIESIGSAVEEDRETLGHLLLVAGKIAREQGLEATGYRLVVNNGQDAGQTVAHLHIHLLGGRPMNWPPG